jgi:hypothetical protein
MQPSKSTEDGMDQENAIENPSVSIEEITFSGGDTYQFSAKEKVILVGSNNSGKSKTLRDIMDRVANGRATEEVQVVTGINLTKVGSKENLREFLLKNAKLVADYFRYGDWQIHVSVPDLWENPYLINGLHNGFIKNLTANERLSICEQQASISPGDPMTRPQHVMFDSEALTKRISNLFRKAFGKDLLFDYRGGRTMPIHVGEIPGAEVGTNWIADEFVAAVRKNPLLDKQGDGMKSYAGILFEAVVSNRDITLIDEPEAFLHPPQMRRLGETLSSEVVGQLIVATHSSDILRGFLEGTKGDVRILRIRREGDKNVVTEAASEVVQELWDKPELRYSNALEGIFHEQTIICEDDSDCRVFNSVADHMSGSSSDAWIDTAYVPTGGKAGVSKIANALRKIGVPTKAVFDIDFLSEESTVRATVEAFGGSWSEVRPLWKRVDSAVRKGGKAKTQMQIKDEIRTILDAPGNIATSEVKEAMKQTSEWNYIKRFGDVAIPPGDATSDYYALREGLENIGIYVGPCGEIENFCREIGSHGPKFVTKLLSTISLGDEKLNGLRQFVSKVHHGRHGLLPTSSRQNALPETE